MATSRCPVCRAQVAPREENADFPFCSERCRLLDLGRWLDASYRIPVKSADEDEDGGAIPDAAPESEEEP